MMAAVRDGGRRVGGASLSTAEERLLSALTEPVVIAGLDNRIGFVNLAASNLLGWRAEDLRGEPVTAIIPERLRAAHVAAFEAFVRSHQPRLFGTALRMAALRSDGAEIDVELVLSAYTLDAGAPVVLATLRDARAQVNLERRSNMSGHLLQVLAERLGEGEAVPKVLEAIGTTLGWEVADLWVVDPDVQQLRCGGVWASGAPGSRFEAVTLGGLFPAGIDLPGRVWESGEPLWIADLSRDAEFVRGGVAAAQGLVTGFAFPVSRRSKFLGVIELLSTVRREPDAALMATMSPIGELVGDFLERSQRDEERQRLLDELSTERSRLQAVIHQMPAGVMISDATGDAVLQGNDLATELLGAPIADDLSGEPQLHFTIVDHHGGMYDNRELPIAQAARTGRTVSEELEVRRADGANAVVSMSASPIFDRQGRVVSAVAVVHDVTARRAAERRYRILARVSELLSSSLDSAATLEVLARLVLPELADACVVDLLDGAGVAHRLVAAFADRSVEARAGALKTQFPPDMSKAEGIPRVLRSGEPVLYEIVTDSLLQAIARDEKHLQLMRELRFRSTMIVPLTAHGRVIGTLTFNTTTSNREFGPEDLELALEVATRAGSAIANAQLYERERDTAATLQRSLLPPSLPSVAGLDLGARFTAGRSGLVVGGDFYDVFPIGEGRWGFVIGDVCGTGAEAASVAVHVRHAVRAAAEGLTPSEVLTRVNASLLDDLGDQRFCTAVYGMLERRGADVHVTVASAGHPFPVLIRADGDLELLACGGTLLGVLDDASFDQDERVLGAGDALVLYTDGVVEARNASGWFGEAGLVRCIREAHGRSAVGMAEHIEAEVLRFCATTSADDIAVLVVKVDCEGAP
jgi:PAS domain S-box-containing protein